MTVREVINQIAPEVGRMLLPMVGAFSPSVRREILDQEISMSIEDDGGIMVNVTIGENTYAWTAAEMCAMVNGSD